MIDFHSHILPNVDDGSKSYEETIELLEEAKNVGFDKIISTSHYAVGCYEIPEYKRMEIIGNIKEEVQTPEIILGSEIFVSYNIIDLLKEYHASTINGTNYVLIELPLKHHFNNLKYVIDKLQENNYKIILAHPERYDFVRKNFNILYELKSYGILFQSNFGSILGKYGLSTKLVIKKMLKNNLVTFLGTDVHRKNTIYPLVPKAISKISNLISNEELEQITKLNAEKILLGEEIC